MELSSEDPSCRQYRWPCAPGSDKSHAGISNHRLGETQRQHEMSARRLHGLRDRGRDAGHRTLSALPVDEGNDRRSGEEQEAPWSLHALRRWRRGLSEKGCRRARIRPVFVGGPHADQTNIKVRHEPRKQPAATGRLKSGTVSIGWKHSIRYAFDQPQGDLCNVVLGGARRSYTKMCSKERTLEPHETRITIPLSDEISASQR